MLALNLARTFSEPNPERLTLEIRYPSRHESFEAINDFLHVGTEFSLHVFGT